MALDYYFRRLSSAPSNGIITLWVHPFEGGCQTREVSQGSHWNTYLYILSVHLRWGPCSVPRVPCRPQSGSSRTAPHWRVEWWTRRRTYSRPLLSPGGWEKHRSYEGQSETEPEVGGILPLPVGEKNIGHMRVIWKKNRKLGVYSFHPWGGGEEHTSYEGQSERKPEVGGILLSPVGEKSIRRMRVNEKESRKLGVYPRYLWGSRVYIVWGSIRSKTGSWGYTPVTCGGEKHRLYEGQLERKPEIGGILPLPVGGEEHRSYEGQSDRNRKLGVYSRYLCGEKSIRCMRVNQIENRKLGVYSHYLCGEKSIRCMRVNQIENRKLVVYSRYLCEEKSIRCMRVNWKEKPEVGGILPLPGGEKSIGRMRVNQKEKTEVGGIPPLPVGG